MNYCVLVKISKHKASFWYQSEGGPYAPLTINESNEIPLYFYVCGNDYIFGSAAKDRFYCNDPNAYGDYFEIVKDPTKHFNIYGNQKPVKQLLYYGIEQYLSHFINTVLYKSESIESYRQNFPIRFIFDTDVEDKEKVLIESLFKEAGYDNVERIIFQEVLLEVLINQGLIKFNESVLLLTGINDNLYLELYKSSTGSISGFSKLIGLGADPRVKILAEEILEDILAIHPYLAIKKEIEIAGILSYAAGLINENVAIIKGKATLSDGKSYSFEVKKRKLNERLNFVTNDGALLKGIESLLETNGVTATNLVILLVGKEINTSFFEKKLLANYLRVIGVDTAHFVDTMKSIFLKIFKSGYSKKKDDLPYLESKVTPPPPPKLIPQTPPLPPVSRQKTTVPTVAPPPPIPTKIKQEANRGSTKVSTPPPLPVPKKNNGYMAPPPPPPLSNKK